MWTETIRTFAWLGRNRRLAKDFEANIASAEFQHARLGTCRAQKPNPACHATSLYT